MTVIPSLLIGRVGDRLLTAVQSTSTDNFRLIVTSDRERDFLEFS